MEELAVLVLFGGRKEVLGFGGSGAAVLRYVGDALCGGCTWEPPGRAHQSQGLSCTPTPARSESGGGGGGGVQGLNIFFNLLNDRSAAKVVNQGSRVMVTEVVKFMVGP